MNVSEKLALDIEELMDEKINEKMKVLEETYFAKSQQTLFTKAELADKWGCTKGTVDRILKKCNVEPSGKRGNEFEYSIELAQEAKDYHDNRELRKHKISVRARTT